jgi:UDP-3-O-[3-hydroxymyristoyl] glucosamine N-acyltransferase
MSITTAQIAAFLEGSIIGDPNLPLTGFAPAHLARAGDLTFAENETYFRAAEQSAASAIMVDTGFSSTSKTIVTVPNARLAFARVLSIFHPEPKYPAGAHPTAVVAPTAQIDATAWIGPGCVVGDRCRIGARSVLISQVYVGNDAQVGDDAVIYPLVSIYARSQIGSRVRLHSGCVIGSDGFGYVLDRGAHFKVPQVGNVIIHDDVEIGANTTVDRGALGPTVIGKGTKIDNLVQVAHNVEVGEHCLLIAQSGIAGSAKLGNYVTLAGQAGIAGHLRIGNQVVVAAKAGVMNSIPDGERWLGAPAGPAHQTKRQMIALQQLPELIRRVHALEKQLTHEEKNQDLSGEHAQEHG